MFTLPLVFPRSASPPASPEFLKQPNPFQLQKRSNLEHHRISAPQADGSSSPFNHFHISWMKTNQVTLPALLQQHSATGPNTHLSHISSCSSPATSFRDPVSSALPEVLEQPDEAEPPEFSPQPPKQVIRETRKTVHTTVDWFLHQSTLYVRMAKTKPL